MKQRTTIRFVGGNTPTFVGSDLGGRHFVWTIEGEYEVVTQQLDRFVEIQLLDGAGRTSEGQRRITWTYIDDLDTPLDVGDIVQVPFGWGNTAMLGKVVQAGQEPNYTGPGEVKYVTGRMGLVAE